MSRIPRPTAPQLLATALLLVALTGCDDADPPSPDAAVPTTDVEVADNEFRPEAIEVAPGTEVTWTWVGDNRHDVVADGDGASIESELQTEGTFTATFEDPGTVAYRCTIHPSMTGLVVVTGGASEGA